jgi:hypothetical protein
VIGVSFIEVASAGTRLLHRFNVDIPFRLLLEAADISGLCDALEQLVTAPGAEMSRVRPRENVVPQRRRPDPVHDAGPVGLHPESVKPAQVPGVRAGGHRSSCGAQGSPGEGPVTPPTALASVSEEGRNGGPGPRRRDG